jgi:hypothetical protein
MFSKLLVAVLLIASSPGLTQNNNRTITQAPSGATGITPPPIKMGLWEATITNSIAANSIKTQSCVTPQSYQDAMAHVPPGCTITNKVQTSTSITADVSCTLQRGGTTTGHLDVELPDPGTMRSTIKLTINANGQSVPMTLTTESHFLSADCGDVAPGQAKIIK